MEELPYDDLSQLIVCVKKCYTGTQVEQRNASDILQRMGRDPTRFINSMMNLISFKTADNDVESVNLKRASCVVVSTIFSGYIERTSEQNEYILNVLLESFFNANISVILKRILQRVLPHFYEQDNTGDLRKQGLALVEEKLLYGQIDNAFGALLILETIMGYSKSDHKIFADWFHNLVEGLEKAGKLICSSCKVELGQINRGLAPPIHNQLSPKFIYLNQWALVISKFTKQLAENEKDLFSQLQLFKSFVRQENILHIFKEILNLSLTNDNQISGCLLSTSKIYKMDQTLNMTKGLVLKCFTNVLEFIKVVEKSAEYITSNIFYSYITTEGQKLVTNSLFLLFQTKDYGILEENDIEESVVECLKLLIRLTKLKEPSNLFQKNEKSLLMDVIFPLLQSSKREMQDFKVEPEQFVLLALDICQNRVHFYRMNLFICKESETYKGQASLLLREMCANIEGFLNQIVKMILDIIVFTLISDNPTEISFNFPSLADYQNSKFLTSTNSVIRVETCIFALTALSSHIICKPDLTEPLENVFGKYVNYFVGDTAPTIIKARMCLFLACFLEHIFIFEEQKPVYYSYQEFLLNSTGKSGEEYQSLGELANQAIAIILNNPKGPSYRLSLDINNVILQLSANIKYSKSNIFFDNLFELFQAYEDSIKCDKQLVLNVLKLLLEKVKEEYLITQNDLEASKTILCKSIHTIIHIAAINSYIVEFQEEMEEYIGPLFVYLEDESPIEDELFWYISTVIRVKKEVTPFFWKNFQYFSKIFLKNHCNIETVFQPLNQFIIHGKEKINQTIEIIENLVEMSVQGLNPTHNSADSFNVVQAALILQLLIQHIALPSHVLERILVSCIKKFKASDEAFIQTRIAGVFLCAFYFYFEDTQKILFNNDSIFILEYFLENSKNFMDNSYEIKVICMGLIQLLAQPEIHPLIAEKLPKILAIVIPLLKYSEMRKCKKHSCQSGSSVDSDDDSFEHPKSPNSMEIQEDEDDSQTENKKISLTELKNNEKNEKEKNCNDVDDDDNDEDSDSYIFLSVKHQFKALIATLETHLTQTSEFAFFKNTIDKMKEHSLETFENLFHTLPESKKDLMKEILNNQTS